MFGERERDALGDQVEQIARRRRCGCRPAGTCPCRRARSRRPGRRVKPRRSASDGHGDRSSHSPMQNPNRAGWPNTVFVVSPARWPPMLRRHSDDRAPDRHRAAARGAAHAAGAVVDAERRRGTGRSRCSIGNTLDVVVVSPNAFHSGSEIASSAASTSGNAAGSHAGHRRVDRDELDGRDAVAPAAARTTTWSAGYGVAASSASIASSVGGQQRHAVAPALGERRARTARAGRRGTSTCSLGERHAVHPEQLEHLRVVLVGDRAQLRPRAAPRAGTAARAPSGRRGRGGVATLCPCTVELLAYDRDHRLLVLLDRDRVLDRERGARAARAEPDDRARRRRSASSSMCLRSSAPVWPTCAPVSTSDRRRAVAPQVLVPDRSRSAATSATPRSVRMPIVQAGERPVERGTSVRSPRPAGGAVGRRTQIVSAGDAGFVKAFVMAPWSQIHAGACNLHAVAYRFDTGREKRW